MFLRRRCFRESKCEMTFLLIFCLHLILFPISPSFYNSAAVSILLCSLFHSQAHSLCLLFCFCPDVFCLCPCFIFVSVFPFVRLALTRRLLLNAPVVLLIHCLLMQEDTKFPFEKCAQPVAPHVDLVYHILQVCAV